MTSEKAISPAILRSSTASSPKQAFRKLAFTEAVDQNRVCSASVRVSTRLHEANKAYVLGDSRCGEEVFGNTGA
jgi:hypothetical protein